MRLTQLAAEFDALFEPRAFPGDRSLNGLQVGGNWKVERVAFALDARMSVVRRAAAEGAQLLFVHHGLFWGAPLALTGATYALLATCVEKRLGIYAAHLPLDAQIDFGVNAQWAKRLGLRNSASFADIRGLPLGACGDLPAPVAAADLAARIRQVTGDTVLLREFGPAQVRRVAVLGGSVGPGEVEAAVAHGAQLLLTGEQSLPVDIQAEALGIHVCFAGHSATEIPGVQGFKDYFDQHWGMDSILIHEPTGL